LLVAKYRGAVARDGAGIVDLVIELFVSGWLQKQLVTKLGVEPQVLL